jgi:diketogulonate reductase-like aldo/keto reductase
MFAKSVTALALLALGANAQYIKTKPDFVDPAITSGKAVGDEIPKVGFGTWTIPNTDAGVNAVARAIALGYRHLDGATAYGNQVTVGKGIAKALKENPNIKREELWVTTKIWATRHKDVEGAMKVNLQQLGLDYVDLALVHFPVGNAPGPQGKTVASYDFVDVSFPSSI